MKDILHAIACSKYMKGLSDPERLRIVQCLRAGPMNVGEITEALQEKLPNVSHHLRVLKHTGIVCDRKDGKFVVYSLNPEIFKPDDKGRLPEILEFGCCRVELGKKR